MAEKMAKMQFAFSEYTCAVLEKLKDDLGASSKAEVVRNAISFYKWAIEEQQQGKKIFTENLKTKERYQVVFPLVSHKKDD